MLVYKHGMLFGGPFWHAYMEKKFLFQVAIFEAQNDKKGLKIERWEQRLACPINRSQTPKYYTNWHFKENLKYLDKKGFENSELKILEYMQN